MVSARYARLSFRFAFGKAFTASSKPLRMEPASSYFQVFLLPFNGVVDLIAVRLFIEGTTTNLIINHINSTPKEFLNVRTPYSIALEALGEDTLKAFQIRPIAPDEVILTPKLIHFNR